MKKTVFAVVVILLIGACLPLTPAPNPSPNVDVVGTAEANLKTAVVQTLTAQPTFTSAPPTDTTTPTITSVVALSPTITSSPTIDPTILASTGTAAVATGTNLPPTVPSGLATLTPTLGILTYGTLPPAVPFSQVTLINKSKTQAYISLQVVTAEGGPTIIEYPVSGQIKIKAPIGQYLYVAWVGGRKMVGEFRLHRDENLSIILYKDRVVIK
jgi:hypothetical protein